MKTSPDPLRHLASPQAGGPFPVRVKREQADEEGTAGVDASGGNASASDEDDDGRECDSDDDFASSSSAAEEDGSQDGGRPVSPATGPEPCSGAEGGAESTQPPLHTADGSRGEGVASVAAAVAEGLSRLQATSSLGIGRGAAKAAASADYPTASSTTVSCHRLTGTPLPPASLSQQQQQQPSQPLDAARSLGASQQSPAGAEVQHPASSHQSPATEVPPHVLKMDVGRGDRLIAVVLKLTAFGGRVVDEVSLCLG